jgi:signal transduction histidine kinase
VGEERTRVFGELELLKKNINHVNVIISMQQSHAKHLGVTEELAPSEVLEDALNLELASCVEQGIAVVRDFADETPIHVDRHKLLQIVTNLLANARHAVNDGRSGKRQITVSTRSVDDDSVAIEVHDTGLGIPAENLTQIFNLGFTTKKEGHGFGLHSSACAAIEMGGTLTAHSDGQDQGALFRLVLPIGGDRISDHGTIPPPS